VQPYLTRSGRGLPRRSRGAEFLADVLTFTLALLFAAWATGSIAAVQSDVELHIRIAVIWSLGFAGLLYEFGAYEDRRVSTPRMVSHLLRPIGLTIGIGVIAALLSPSSTFPKSALFISLAVGAGLSLLRRVIVSAVGYRLRGPLSVVVAADLDRADQVDQSESLMRLRDDTHVSLAGVFDYRDVAGLRRAGAEADVVVVSAAVPDPARSLLATELMDDDISLFVLPTAFEVALFSASRIDIHSVDGLFLPNGRVPWLTATIKRFSDVVVSVIGLVLVAPLLPLVWLAVRLDSPGPALFSQTRVGQNGEIFTLYKFRSMRTDAEDGTGAVLATANDPRITRIGGFLRKTRLDELPQLWNVARGDMSLIGPRPERPEFVELYAQEFTSYRRRFTVRPGLTGLAQVRAGYGATVEEKLRFDLSYIARMSFLVDVRIGAQTLATIIDFSAAEGTRGERVVADRSVAETAPHSQITASALADDETAGDKAKSASKTTASHAGDR